MDQSEKDSYIQSGKTVQKARKIAREQAEPGVKLADIAEKVEKSIRGEGLEPAFPVNLSINEQAAHYTPPPGGDRKLRSDDVLKIDIGAHSDGFIADTALTVNPSGKHQEIIDTVEEVLESALDFVEPGKTIGEFGRHVEKQVPDEYNVVTNLTGHYLDRYTQHAGVSVPNCDNASTHEFKKGDAVAIEPFISTGSGKMMNGKPGNIYMLESNRSVRGRAERKLMGEIKDFNGLPFTSRWLKNYGGRYKMALNKLVQQGVVKSYDVLKDREGSIVAQAEHTVLVGADDGENIVTTRR